MAESSQYSRSVLGASDEIKEIYCEPCGKDGLVALADGYCKDCHEYLCTQCYKTHRRNKMLANHVLLDKNLMPITSSSKKRVLDICKEKCTIHSDKVIELFCETCDKLGCTICITIDHRQCRKVKHIPDIAKDLKHNQEFTAFQECIKSTTDKLSEFEQKVQANVTSNTKMEKLARQELQRQRAEVNKFFDELEKKMDDQILTIETRNKDTVKKAFDKLKRMKIDLDQIKNAIEEKKSGQTCELFISMKKNKEKIKIFDDKVNKLQGELQHFTLIPSEQIETMMRTTTEICKISTAVITTEISKTPTARSTTETSKTPTARSTTETSKTPTARSTTETSKTPTARTTTETSKTPTARSTTETSKTPTARTTTEISKTPTARTSTDISSKQTARTTTQFSGTPKARHVSVIDIKTKKDKTEPNIYSLTTMHGHFCVVADNGNTCIKVVDTKRKTVTSEIGIKAKTIWSVKSVSDDQVVVSVTLSAGKYQIQFFSVSTSGVIQSTNQLYCVDDKYMDMVYSKGNIYGVNDDKIDILSMTGTIIRTIQTDDKGANLFGDLRGIALSPDGQTIHVTDRKKKSVTSLTLDGNVNAIYTDKELQNPWGITVDKHGYVYVCCQGTCNIQQLTEDLSKVQVLIDTADVISITYSITENKLFTDDNDSINVYSLN